MSDEPTKTTTTTTKSVGFAYFIHRCVYSVHNLEWLPAIPGSQAKVPFASTICISAAVHMKSKRTFLILGVNKCFFFYFQSLLYNHQFSHLVPVVWRLYIYGVAHHSHMHARTDYMHTRNVIQFYMIVTI